MHMQLEMMLVLDGSLYAYIDGQKHLLGKGDMTFVFPNCIHGRASAGQRPAYVAITAVVPQFTGQFSQTVLHFRPRTPVLPAADVSPAVIHAFEQLLELSREVNQGQYAEILIQSYMQIILGWTLPLFQLVHKENKGFSSIQKAVDYILKNYTQPITLESAADAAGVGKNHLSAAFSKHMGMSFNQYVNNIRLHSAREALRYTDKSITEIAYACGFGSLRTFNRLFADRFQQTPSAYRRSLSEERPPEG